MEQQKNHSNLIQSMDVQNKNQLTQLTFTFTKLSLSPQLIQNILITQNQQQQAPLNKKIIFKLKFYCATTNNKLIQKVQKTSISKSSSNQIFSYEFSTKKQIKFKVSFPIHQQNQILGKIELFQKSNESKDKRQIGQKLNRFCGDFKINLSEWAHEIEEINVFKNCQDNCLQGQQLNSSTSITKQIQVNEIKANLVNTKNDNQKNKIPLRSVLTFKVQNLQLSKQNLQNHKNNESKISRISIKSQNHKQKYKKMLKIVSRVVNQKINFQLYNRSFNRKINKQNGPARYDTIVRHDRPNILAKISRSRSQAVLNNINDINQMTNDQIIQNYQNSNIIISKPTKKLNFKDQINQLLKQVKQIKKQRQAQKYPTLYKSRLYCKNQVRHYQSPTVVKMPLKQKQFNKKVNYYSPSYELNQQAPTLGKMVNSIVSFGGSNHKRQQKYKINEYQSRDRMTRIQNRLASYEKLNRIEKQTNIKV